MSLALLFDTETTGLDPMTGDKIIEICLLTYDLGSRQLVDSYTTRLDPERAISAKAQEVHGISYGELVGMPKFADVAVEIHNRFIQASMVVAHNLSFDAGFMLCEFSAAGLALPNKPSIDTMEEGRWACVDGKFPRLSELCFALGVEFDDSSAHSAEYDTEKMAECLFKGLDRGFYTLPKGVM